MFGGTVWDGGGVLGVWVLTGLYLLDLHSLFCHRPGLSCWTGIAPETYALSMFSTLHFPISFIFGAGIFLYRSFLFFVM